MVENFSSEEIKVAVLGGGNIGTQFACKYASKGYKVNLMTSRPELFDGTLEIVDELNHITEGKLNIISSDMKDAVKGCKVIFVSHPAFMLRNTADELFPYVENGVNICVLPGTGGAEYSFKKCIDAGANLCGLQRVPSVARLEQYGKRVRCEGIRTELYLAALPGEKIDEMSSLLSDVWDIPCHSLPNYLSVTLTPSNPILHTTRLRTLFSDYEPGKVYDRNIKFYGEWDDESSDRLIKADGELQEICKRLKGIDLSNVKSLKIHYESDSVEDMTKKLRSINSLNSLNSPMIESGGGWIPDFKSRYFTADFPYGLAIIEEIADLLEYEAPVIKDTMDWYVRVTGDQRFFSLEDYGIHSVEDLYDYYNRK